MGDYTIDIKAEGSGGRCIVECECTLADGVELLNTGAAGGIKFTPDSAGSVNFSAGAIQYSSHADFNTPGAIASNTIVAKIETTTGGAEAYSLANGSFEGQRMIILYYIQAGGAESVVITPDTIGGTYTDITLEDIGDTAEVTWQPDGSTPTQGWYITGGTVVASGLVGVGGTGVDNYIATWMGVGDIDEKGNVTLVDQVFTSVSGVANTDVIIDSTGNGAIVMRPQAPATGPVTGGFISRYYISTPSVVANNIVLDPEDLLGGLIRATADLLTSKARLPLTSTMFTALNTGAGTTIAAGDSIDFYILNEDTTGDFDFEVEEDSGSDASMALRGNMLIPGGLNSNLEMQTGHFRWIAITASTAECWRLS